MMAANWKMNKLIREAEEYVKELLPKISSAEGVDVAIFPPFTSLPEVVRATRETPVLAGAQNRRLPRRADHLRQGGERGEDSDIYPFGARDLRQKLLHVLLGLPD